MSDDFTHFVNGDPAVAVTSLPDVTVVAMPDVTISSMPAVSVDVSALASPLKDIYEALEPTTSSQFSIDQPTFFDLFDPANPDPYAQLIKFAPAGIDYLGSQPSSMSLPVALAQEQIQDKYIKGFGLGAGFLNYNILSDQPPGNGQPWTDCIGFESIYIQINTIGAVTGAITFEGSNDGLYPCAVQMVDLAAPATTPVTNFTLATTTQRFWGGPLQFRYFRARVSTILAGGNVMAITTLRRAPFAPVQNIVSMGEVGGTPTVTTGVAGMIAVGGNIAPGTAPTARPVLVAGQDNNATPLTRTMTTDTAGSVGVATVLPLSGTQTQVANPVTVTGPQLGYKSGGYAPVQTKESPYIEEDMSMTDLLLQILLQLKVHSFYLQHLPLMDKTGQIFMDDPDSLIKMFTSDEIQYNQ
jgi:hypothetical protein